jgi:cell division protein FtsL
MLLEVKNDISMQNSGYIYLYIATLITAKAVIPAPYQVRDKLQQESRKILDSPVSSTGQAQSSPE